MLGAPGVGVSAVCMASVWEQWLLRGSGSGRMEVLSIPAVHLDSLGMVMRSLLSGVGVMDATGIRPSCTQ